MERSSSARHLMHASFSAALLAGTWLAAGCAQSAPPARSVPAAVPQIGAAAAGQAPQAEAAPRLDARKLIFNGTLELRIEDYETAAREVAALVQSHGGYVAAQNESNLADSQRYGTWTLRVPPDRFDALMAACALLGEVRRREVRVQDVTEEFVDLEARERTKKVEEERLLELLKTASSTLEDVLAVEKEVARVREEIERIQGRLRILAQQTGYATLTLTLSQLGITPPAQPLSLWAEMSASFFSSLRGLIVLGQTCLVVAAAVVPWLVVILPIGLFVYRFSRSKRPASPVFLREQRSE